MRQGAGATIFRRIYRAPQSNSAARLAALTRRSRKPLIGDDGTSTVTHTLSGGIEYRARLQASHLLVKPQGLSLAGGCRYRPKGAFGEAIANWQRPLQLAA